MQWYRLIQGEVPKTAGYGSNRPWPPVAPFGPLPCMLSAARSVLDECCRISLASSRMFAVGFA